MATREQTVKLNYLRMAPRKVRLIADSIRGLSVNEAEAQLLHQRRRAAKPLLKLLRSAVAAAVQTKKLSSATLVIARIAVDQGPMLKRSLPRARGMATMIQKKMSHVTLTLAERATTPAPRFTIVVPKKVKLPDDAKPKAPKKKAATSDGGEAPREQKPGFFRKVFRRKAV